MKKYNVAVVGATGAVSRIPTYSNKKNCLSAAPIVLSGAGKFLPNGRHRFIIEKRLSLLSIAIKSTHRGLPLFHHQR